ncbi:zinc knuckle CX2CX4HX4C containing protein [Tanacetum coccineum]|uniref:Zinc knuckle CX2CX4HX4C containing protein n=1 Tax=Tanacetum coccineum TaxID=301880 RepID=A0ABQ5BPM4_9ASTR
MAGDGVTKACDGVKISKRWRQRFGDGFLSFLCFLSLRSGMEKRVEMANGELLLRRVAERMNKRTGKTLASQPRKAVRVLVNPNFEFPSKYVGTDDNLVANADEEGLTQSPLECGHLLVSPTAPLPPHQSNVDVAAIFGVSLTTVGDLEVLIKDIDVGKHEELLYGMTNDKRKVVIDALGAMCDLIEALTASKLPNDGFNFDGTRNAIDDVAALCRVPLNSPKEIDEFTKDLEVDINTKSTSYAGAAGASAKDQPKFNSNFIPLVVDPVFDGVNISIPRKVVKKVSTRFEHTLYGYFIGKRMAFQVVEYYARNNWTKPRLKRIMMNTTCFFFFKLDSRVGLEAVLEGGPWLIRNSLIILKKWSMDTRLLKEELTRIPIWVKLHDVPLQVFEEDGISLIAMSSFAWCLIEVNSKVDLVDFVPIGIPSLTGDDFTKETIRVEYEWRPLRCDLCKIFGHVHNHCPKKVVSPPIVTTSNVITPTVEKTNVGFQTVCKNKKRKGKSKSTNGGQFAGPSVKQSLRYEPKASTNTVKKVITNVSNASNSSSMLKTTGTSSKKDNITTSNSYSALYEEEENVKNVYDESASLFTNTKTSGSSSFTAAAG